MERTSDSFKNVTSGISALNIDMTSFSMSESTDVLTADITVKCENLDTEIEIAVSGEIVATLLVNSAEALDLLGTEIRGATLVLQKLFADEG